LGQVPPKAASPETSEATPLGDALVFMQVLWAVAHGLESASKRMHARLGVTGPQRLVVRIIGHHGRISAGELAEVMRIHPSSLTGMLRRLEQAELVRRETDPFDRRRALLQLTRKGIRLNDQREGTIEAAVDEALSQLSKERVGTTKAVLRAIAVALARAGDADEADAPSASVPSKAHGRREAG
jgi:MarR family transcriptional regulator, organic hydroperoxide resistance regulator